MWRATQNALRQCAQPFRTQTGTAHLPHLLNRYVVTANPASYRPSRQLSTVFGKVTSTYSLGSGLWQGQSVLDARLATRLIDDGKGQQLRSIRSRAKRKPPMKPSYKNKAKRASDRYFKVRLVGVPTGRSGWGLEDDVSDQEVEVDEHGEIKIERIPVPEGIPTDHMAYFEISDSARGLGRVPGVDSLFAVHGPSEVWAPHPDGLTHGHGACGGIFAIFQGPGADFKVMEGDVFYTNRFVGEVNSQVMFDNVSVIGAVDWSWFGRPCIRDASIVTTIEEQARTAKIYITKFKRKTGYKRRLGHRQDVTRFRVNEIRYTLPDKSRFSEHIPPYDPHQKERNFRFKL